MFFKENLDLNFRSPSVRLRRAVGRTRFGPWMVNGSVVYGRYASCMNYALRRVTCARHPTLPGICELMERQQRSIFKMGGYREWLRQMRWRAKSLLSTKPDPDTWRREWAEAAHPKRALRIAEMRAIGESGREWHSTWLRGAKYKMKPLERAKYGKKPRGIGDLGVAASAKAGYIASAIKEVFSKEFFHLNTRFRFIDSPNKNKLREIFVDMHSSPYTEFVFYSDDAIVAHTEDGVRKFANVDISSCDGSNFEPIFSTLKRIMCVDDVYSRDVIGCFEQLRSPLTISNPERPREKVTLKTLKTTLFSGSTLTTLVNNVANSMIGLSMTNHLRRGYSLRDSVVHGAFAVGYDVTYDECEHIQGLQFLKHSPFWTESGLEVNLNIGVLLRTFGECDGRLPGKQRLGERERAERFMSEVMRSYKHCGFNPVFDVFRDRFLRQKKYNYDIEKRSYSAAPGVVTGDQLALRYGFTVVELFDFCEHIRASKLGDWISHNVIRRALHVDYGFAL